MLHYLLESSLSRMGVKVHVNMQSAYIYLVEGSTVSQASLADVKSTLQHYMEATKKTGQQLGWTYSDVAFPYQMEEKQDGTNTWLLLRGKDPKSYKYIIIGVGSKEENGKEAHYIQVTLPEAGTQGDYNKANEYCRFIAREYKGELHLFNNRVQYFQPRKP